MRLVLLAIGVWGAAACGKKQEQEPAAVPAPKRTQVRTIELKDGALVVTQAGTTATSPLAFP